jgi:uncharacterized protein YecT (DUF1311 family)
VLRTAIVVVAALTAVTAGYAAGGPPVIKEGFTKLPCPARPSTTLQLEGCAEKAVLQTDAVINTRVAKIYGKLTGSGRASFVSGEKTWLRYRRASCTAQAARYAGGTFEPVAYARCEAARNRNHAADLSVLLANLRP